MKLFSPRKRPVHLGPYPLERLPRAANPAADSAITSGSRPAEVGAPGLASTAHAYQLYLDLFDSQRAGEASEPAPIPDDAQERAENLKGGLYFLDADMAGCGLIPDDVWTAERAPNHTHAIVQNAESPAAPRRRMNAVTRG